MLAFAHASLSLQRILSGSDRWRQDAASDSSGTCSADAGPAEELPVLEHEHEGSVQAVVARVALVDRREDSGADWSICGASLPVSTEVLACSLDLVEVLAIIDPSNELGRLEPPPHLGLLWQQ